MVILPTHEFFLFLLQWQTFCDFKDIIDVSIKRACHEQAPQDSRMVTITRNDDRCLVGERSYNQHFPNHWFLLVDNVPALIWFNTCMFIYPCFAHRRPSSRVSRRHFHLCRSLTATSDWPQIQATTSAKTLLLQVFWKGSKTIVTAQSRESVWLKLNPSDTIHISAVLDVSFISCLIRSEFAVNKLKRSGFKGGTFLLRQSPKDYDNFFLTVCVQVKIPVMEWTLFFAEWFINYVCGHFYELHGGDHKKGSYNWQECDKLV